MDFSTLLLNGGHFRIPAGMEGRALVETFDHSVPRRSAGRPSAHRERYCFVILLKTLLTSNPDLFLASADRGESPDFLFTCASGEMLAIEHTDAGEQEHQRHLTETEDVHAPVFVPSPDDAGWIGDQPERAFLRAVETAIAKKAAAKFWSRAPHEAKRWLLMYDQTNTRLFVDDASARELLGKAAVHAGQQGFAFQRVVLVRGPNKVLQCESEERGL